jgi:hypothetical protein
MISRGEKSRFSETRDEIFLLRVQGRGFLLIEEGQKRAFVRGRILWRYQALQVTDFTD